MSVIIWETRYWQGSYGRIQNWSFTAGSEANAGPGAMTASAGYCAGRKAAYGYIAGAKASHGYVAGAKAREDFS